MHCSNQEISAVTKRGTFQQYCLADGHYATRIPENVPFDVAAPLLCAGVTVYHAIRQSHVRPGEFLAIFGAGGGLGHLAVQLGKAMVSTQTS